jgi:hypothetical protein
MNSVVYTQNFKRRAKRLFAKYRSLRQDLENLEQEILENPRLGESLGANIFKVRLKVKSKGGGLRIIIYLIQEFEAGFRIYYLTVYDKSEEESISKSDILQIVSDLDF